MTFDNVWTSCVFRHRGRFLAKLRVAFDEFCDIVDRGGRFTRCRSRPLVCKIIDVLLHRRANVSVIIVLVVSKNASSLEENKLLRLFAQFSASGARTLFELEMPKIS